MTLGTIYADDIRGAVDDLQSFIRRKEMAKDIQGINLADLDDKINDSLNRLNDIADNISKMPNNIEIKDKPLDMVTMNKVTQFRTNFYKKMIDTCQDFVDMSNDLKERYKDQIDQEEINNMDNDIKFFADYHKQYQDKLKDLIGVDSQ